MFNRNNEICFINIKKCVFDHARLIPLEKTIKKYVTIHKNPVSVIRIESFAHTKQDL